MSPIGSCPSLRTLEGPRGKLTKNFKHLNLDFQLITDEATGKLKLKIDSWFGSRKTTAAVRTALSHVQNLITGVTKGYRYKMRIMCAHFLINASITGATKSIEIRNFLGEKKVFGPSPRQKDLYEQAIVPIVSKVLEGFNCTIFAYGKIGVGKTCTMEGDCKSQKM